MACTVEGSCNAGYQEPDPSLLTPFWSQKPSILLQTDQLTSFFPTTKQSMVENLNAVVRLTLYLSVALVFYTRNPYYVYLVFLGFLVTYVMFTLAPNQEMLSREPMCDSGCNNKKTLHETQTNLQRLEREVEKSCVRPTVNNPFMNYNILTDNIFNPPACKAYTEDTTETQKLREDVDDKFNVNLYRDVSDLYSKSNSQRQFFTMPWTSWPNDQTSFAKWLYRTGPTCKELGVKCAPYWSPNVTNSKLDKF